MIDEPNDYQFSPNPVSGESRLTFFSLPATRPQAPYANGSGLIQMTDNELFDSKHAWEELL